MKPATRRHPTVAYGAFFALVAVLWLIVDWAGWFHHLGWLIGGLAVGGASLAAWLYDRWYASDQ